MSPRFQPRFGQMWSEIVEANAGALKPVKLYRKSYKGNVFGQEVKPSDWKSEDGYGCTVKSKADQERDAINGVNKVLAVSAQFPNNLPMKKVKDKKLLDLLDLTPEEEKEVLQYEEQLLLQPPMPMAPPGAEPGKAAAPQVTQMNAPAPVAR